jgi:predicted RNA binding protein YcfA (HicA-like mRNA interferase family)
LLTSTTARSAFREVCRLLEEHGFVEVRQRGSHIVMQKRVAESTVTVPVPNHPDIRSGTLSSIIVNLVFGAPSLRLSSEWRYAWSFSALGVAL